MYHVDVFLCLIYYQWSILIKQHDGIAIKELVQTIVEEELSLPQWYTQLSYCRMGFAL